MNARDAIKFEENVAKLFRSSGWEVIVPARNNFGPDLELRYHGRFVGCVELYLGLSHDSLNRKLLSLEKYAEKANPEVVILTNLVSYYVKRPFEDFQKLDQLPRPEDILTKAKQKESGIYCCELPTFNSCLAKERVNYSKISNSLPGEDKKETNEKDVYKKQCEKEFSTEVWSKLSFNAQEHIVGSVMTKDFRIKKGLAIDKIEQEMACAFEDELLDKIFEKFNKTIKNRTYKSESDNNYVYMINNNVNGYVPVKTMFTRLKYVDSDDRFGISDDLAMYLKDKWKLRAFSEKKKVERAYELIEIRNGNAHSKLDYDENNFNKTKEATIEVLKWFIGAMK